MAKHKAPGMAQVRVRTPILMTALAVAAMPHPSAACTTAPQEVPIIANGAEGTMNRPPELVLKATPGVDGPDEQLLYEPVSLYVGPQGRVYVGDRGHTAIQVYDREGAYLFSFGGKGAGRGEFRFIQGVYQDPEGALIAPDLMNRRINYFTPDGEFLRSTPLNGDLLRGDVLVSIGGGEYLRGGGVSIAVVRESATGAPKEDEEEPKLVEIVNAMNEVVRSFGERKPAEDATLEAVLNGIVTATGGRKVAAGFRVSDDIRIYDVRSGRLERIITRRLPFKVQEPIVKEHDVEVGDGRTFRVNSPITDTVTRALAYDPAGRLWVITALQGTDRTKALEEEGAYGQISRLEVYAPDGRLLCILPLEEPATRLTFDPQGALWLLDSQYNATVRRFEVRWP